MSNPIAIKIIVITFLGVGALLGVLFFVYLYYYIQSLRGKGDRRKLSLVTKAIIGLFLLWLIVLLIGVWTNR
jgi:hypothetical protein